MSDNCWQILGIEKTQDLQVIRSAYRQKLPLFHPETDPQGFKALRAAYEQAQYYAEHPESEPSEDATEPQQIIATDPEQMIIEGLLNEYQQLLDDPKRCYSMNEWHHFINQLDEHSIDITQRLRWPLLNITYNSANLSNVCVAVLAERMRWQQRLMELGSEKAQEIEEYLDYVAKGDDFDLTSLAHLSRSAQQATVSYVHIIKSLYWNRPFNELNYFLSLPTVVYLPAEPALTDKLVRWYSQVNIASETLLDVCLARLQQFPNDPDWLYFTARQYALLDDKENAFTYWLKVYYSGHYTEHASAWLVFWCSLHAPEYLPILVHSMNNSVCLNSDLNDFTDKRHRFVIPAQSPETLARFANATNLSLPPLIDSFVKWNLSENRNYRWVVSLLLQDDGKNPLLRLYRHGVMLWLGDEILLNQIINEADRESPLEHLILDGLKRQAQQQLDWLTHSPVIKIFTQWLYSENSELPLPDIFTREEHNLKFYAIDWLQRLRHVPNHVLIRLQQEPAISVQELGMFDWISNLFYNRDIYFVAPADENDPSAYWQWYRSYLALLALVNAPEANFNYLHDDDTLQIATDHSIYQAVQAIKSIDWHEGDNLAELIFSSMPMDRRLNRMIVNDLALGPENYLTLHDQLDFEDVYQSVTEHWQQQVASSDMIYQLLLKAIYMHQNWWRSPVDFGLQLTQLEIEQPELIVLRDALVNAKPYPYSQAKDPLNVSVPYRNLVQVLDNLTYSSDDLCINGQIEKLIEYKNDTESPFLMRVCAGLLLNWHHSRQERLSRERTKPSHFWQIWSWKSRLGRIGMIYQFLMGLFMAYFLPAWLPSLINVPPNAEWLSNLCLGVVGLNTIVAMKRRLNDIGHNSFTSTFFLIVMIVFPPAILILLGVKGMSGANKHGPEPID